MAGTVNVAVIGAGPYGLSIAAHLRAGGVECRTFGDPMSVWRDHMPQGMFLKSEGFASNLSDPRDSFPISRFLAEQHRGYADVGDPIRLDDFVSYGRAFQQKFVADLEPRMVASLDRHPSGFELQLADGERVIAKRVVVAVGITYFDHLPPVLSGLPPELVTHSSQHHALDRFAGKNVAVIGSGASAVDIAGLLHQAGANVAIVARRPKIAFQNPPSPNGRSLGERLHYPQTGIGYGWKFVFCTELPVLFHYLPERHRLDIVRLYLGPAPGWFVRSQIEGKVATHLGVSLQQVRAVTGGVQLSLQTGDGGMQELVADHVIAGTGYKVDLARIPFLPAGLRSQIRLAGGSPVLSRHFEASVPGLHFIGLASAASFGPVARFAFGARFTARRLAPFIRARQG